MGEARTPPARSALLETSLGLLRLVVSAKGIRELRFLAADHSERRRGRFVSESIDKDRDWTNQWLKPLEAAFAGKARLKLDLVGTPFQMKVWRALCRIPRGKTVTYGEIAKRIGHPAAVRAVGTACGANPIAILVPCHRVLPKGGGLGGYFWGTETKQRLLDTERKNEKALASQARRRVT